VSVAARTVVRWVFDIANNHLQQIDHGYQAVDVGYYDVPRTGDTEAVAAALDCEPSTAGELLRKAEAAVVTDSVEGA